MFRHTTDSDWESLGAQDPYWAVASIDQFRKKNLDDENMQAFFAGGERYIDGLFQLVRDQVSANFAPARALDFGCGVGRLLLPLARRCDQVVGVDVADSMLRVARKHLDDEGFGNAELVHGDDQLTGVRGMFDLVHTYIVLQHIPAERGMRIIRRLVELINPGGVGVLHVLFRFNNSAPRALRPIKSLAKWLARPFRENPPMQMNPYPMNELLLLLHDAGVRNLHVEMTNHGHLGAILMFEKKAPGTVYFA